MLGCLYEFVISTVEYQEACYHRRYHRRYHRLTFNSTTRL